MTLRITDQLSGWLDDELGRQKFGEDFAYDIGWALRQGPQGPACVHTIVVTLRHPVLGHVPFCIPLKVIAGTVPEDKVRAAIGQAVATLREQRRGFLAQLKNGQGPQAGMPPSPFS